MKIEFLASLYRITVELVTEWNLDLNSSKKVLQFKFDWSYLSYYHIFFIIIGIIKKLV